MTWDEQQAAKVKRANSARFEPCLHVRDSEPDAGNRTVGRAIAVLAALCAIVAVALVVVGR